MTRRVIDNYQERLRECVNNEDHHLTDVMF